MKKLLLKISLFFLAVLLVISPFAIFLLIANNQPHIYSKTYYAALVDKVNNLKKHKNDKKIILIGGSNVAFGFNSELLQQEFPEYKVVNFGLYAMTGTKIMMDLAVDYIGKDDMVFIIPEINSQSTSLYFNAEATLKALEDDMSLINKLPKDNKDSVISGYFDFVKQRNKYNKVIEPTGVYQRKNFNEYGDIKYDEVDENNIHYRSANRMLLHYDPTLKVDFSYQIEQSFFDYVNAYHKKVISKKANLYYAFSPVNELSIVNQESISNYYWNIRENLNCDVIGNPNEYAIDPHYFYDSNFHMNDSGAVYRTYQFIKDVYRDINHISKNPSFDLPSKPDYVEISPADTSDDPNASLFNLKEINAGYVIESVKETTKDMKIVRLPKVYNHKYVIGVSSYAFRGSNIEEIYVPNSFHYFDNNAFDSVTSLKNVYLETTKPSDLVVSYLGDFISDASNDFVIYVPNQSLNSYKVDYNWQFYSQYLRGYDYEEN
ncbi:MAG: hypothetical protein IJR08_00645 [Bacilli bacterium]|nr:hypothetical protein [Bacilli bacterium]